MPPEVICGHPINAPCAIVTNLHPGPCALARSRGTGEGAERGESRMGQPFNLSHEKCRWQELRGRSCKHRPRKRIAKHEAEASEAGETQSGAAEIGLRGLSFGLGFGESVAQYQNTSKIQAHRERLGKVPLTPARRGPAGHPSMDPGRPLETDDVERLDEIIAADPEAQNWTFAGHERGALHEAERMMTLREYRTQRTWGSRKRGDRDQSRT